jgi:GNAT superfamily N-acetyltransferase
MSEAEPEAQLHPLHGNHDRATFDCGVGPLNDWLRSSASQQAKNNTARTFVATPMNVPAWHGAGYNEVTENTILGYIALSSGQVEEAQLPRAARKKLPRSVPMARLGRLAVDTRFQGQGLGEVLLMEAVKQALIAAEAIGVAGIFVDAKEDARAFYEKYGFVACEDAPDKMWMPLQGLQKLMQG